MLTFMSTHQRGVSLLNWWVNDKFTVGPPRSRFERWTRRLGPSPRPGSFAISHLFVSNLSICHPTEAAYHGSPLDGAWILKLGADTRGLQLTPYSSEDEPCHCLSGWTHDSNLRVFLRALL